MQITSTGITFVRGDDDALLVGLTNGAVFESGDKVYLSLKSKATDTTDILQIESEEFVTYGGTANAGVLINIRHAQTINLPLGSYFYDILIAWANGTYVTVIQPTKFTLVPGGSHG
jgi:hypothetical protein